jgi:putative ABC transport system permease protein
MVKNNLKMAWRSIVNNKAYSALNVIGLASGMAVAILIGLWIKDELFFNKGFVNYKNLAVVMQHQTFNADVTSQQAVPFLMGDQLRKDYGSDFKNITMSSWTGDHLLTFGEKKITKSGNYFEPQITDMLSIKMLQGQQDALKDEHAVILSKSTATALFGNADPMNKRIKIDNQFDVVVAGIYQDLPTNSDFGTLTFIAPWQLMIDNDKWPEKATNPWRRNSYITYVQLNDGVDADRESAKIKDIKLKQVTPADAAFKPVVFLHPMSKWHLYSEFKNGVNTGGRITYVWQFGIIGICVLLLACINFMNLSTARSERKAKEIGVRKAIGSLRSQLISQFFAESLLVTFFAYAFAILLAQALLPYFNSIAGKTMELPWSDPLFWIAGILFTILTGLIAGAYPAFYLSSFKPVKVLKGTLRAGRFEALPRKVLVVMQFAISVTLIVGTLVVFQQVQYAMNRPVGYSRNGLLIVPMITNDIHKNFTAVSNELKNSGMVSQIAEASVAATNINEIDNGFEWRGKDPSVQGNFAAFFGSVDMGKTIGWQIVQGRDFSRDFATDTTAMILNETAAKFMGLKHPVGETIRWDKRAFTVIGVAKDMVMGSPYEPVYQAVFVLDPGAQSVIDVRINPNASLHQAIDKISAVFKQYNPAQPFTYSFTDDEYAKKFSDEQRLGNLAGGFAILAIFISCLGLLGMASYTAEQRRKEIGIRKVLGDSVFGIWKMLSKEFIVLVVIALCLSIPTSYYFMHGWLKNYQYHTNLSWQLFAIIALGAAMVTLLTVSYQSVRAALVKPIKSLRSE